MIKGDINIYNVYPIYTVYDRTVYITGIYTGGDIFCIFGERNSLHSTMYDVCFVYQTTYMGDLL